MKEIVLTMGCPKCGEQMKSTANLRAENEIALDEFEGMDYECSCGYKVHVLTVEPRDDRGQKIY